MNFKTRKKTRRLERKVARRLQRKTHAVIAKFAAKKKGMYWWGCSGYPECKQTYFDDNGKPKYEVTEKK